MEFYQDQCADLAKQKHISGQTHGSAQAKTSAEASSETEYKSRKTIEILLDSLMLKRNVEQTLVNTL